MKTNKLFRYLVIPAAALAMFTIAACGEDDDHNHDDEGEVITTLKVTFTDSANTAEVRTAIFKDPDGVGGNGPTQFDTIKLANNRTYNATVQLLNESNPNDVKDKTTEIIDEKNDHLFGYSTTISGLTITRTDVDGNNQPFGLNSKWRTGAAGIGTATVVLKHQPGIKNGDLNIGETDIEVVFQARVQ